MPHLQFEINKNISSSEKEKFILEIRDNFSKIMKTGFDHIAISLKVLDKYSIFLGRVKTGEKVCIMNLDVREGRTPKQKRMLVKEYIAIVQRFFKIPKSNQYVTFTEHKGEDFNLLEKSLENWVKNDDPLS